MSYKKRNASGIVKGLSVELRNNDFNKAYRQFKKKVQEDGILQEAKERRYYEKPSEQRTKAAKAAKSRHKKALREQLR